MTIVRMKNSPNWHADFRDHNGIRHRLSLCSNKGRAERLAEQIERLRNARWAGETPDATTMKWLESCGGTIREKLAEWGLVGRAMPAGGVAGLIDRYQDYQVANGITKRDAKHTAERIRRVVIEGLGARRPVDITPAAVLADLAKRKRAGDFGATTSNRYLSHIKTWMGWLIREQIITTSPIAHLRNLTEDPTARRAFEPEQLAALLVATREGPARFGVTGEDRYWLYRVAVETGLRANELRKLLVSDFDLKGKTIAVRPTAGRRRPKVRSRVSLPLRADTVTELKRYFRGASKSRPAFSVPTRTADMIAGDMTAAKIDIEDSVGRRLVFHSLRHTLGSNLARAGVHPSVAQNFMRHSTIALTMNYYTHVLTGDAHAAAEALPPTSTAKPTTKRRKSAQAS